MPREGEGDGLTLGLTDGDTLGLTEGETLEDGDTEGLTLELPAAAASRTII